MATVDAPVWPELARPLLTPSPEGRARFSREAYLRMCEAGLFRSASHVELLDGEILMMSPIGPEHVALISILNELFARQLPSEFQCRIQAPIILSNHSEPEPDLAVVRRRTDNYRHEHPTSNDIVLIVEVAQSSRQRDLDLKRHLYAASGIVEYWLVDIDEQLLAVHREPNGTDYQQVEMQNTTRNVAPVIIPNCHVDIAMLFD